MHASSPSDRPPPSAEDVKRPPDVQKLDMFVGDWTYEERGKNHDTGEEWVLTGTGEYSKLGDLFYVWHGQEEAGRVLVIDAYDPGTKRVVRHAFGSVGWQGSCGFVFHDESVTCDMEGVTADGTTFRRRCTETLEIPTSTYTCEDLIDGKWVAALKGTQTKVK